MFKEINTVLSKMLENLIHQMPTLGVVGVHTTPAPNSVVKGDCERYCGDITKAMQSYKKVGDDEAKHFIMDQAEIQFLSGMLPSLPIDHDGTDMAIWLGKARMIGFKDIVIQAWRIKNHL